MIKYSKFLLLILTLGVFITSCEKDDPEVPHEEEVITTLNYTLVPNDGGATVVLTFQDLDGDGGDEPIITSGTLSANTVYTGTLELLNESEDPAEDITEEVEEEALEHQFFFQSTLSNINIAYSDEDAEGNPVGLSTVLTTSAAESGTITVILRHEPVKDASGVADGDITNAGGESDIEVTFNINVQ